MYNPRGKKVQAGKKNIDSMILIWNITGIGKISNELFVSAKLCGFATDEDMSLSLFQENPIRTWWFRWCVPLQVKGSFCFVCVVTQFWIHQDFFKCYFISIIIYKNSKKLKKRKIQKYIFLESTASFHKNRFHRVNTGQTMSAK